MSNVPESSVLSCSDYVSISVFSIISEFECVQILSLAESGDAIIIIAPNITLTDLIIEAKTKAPDELSIGGTSNQAPTIEHFAKHNLLC